MSRRTIVDGKRQVTIRIDEDVERRLRAIANDRIVSFAWLCNRILSDAVKRLDGDPLATPPDT